MAYVFNPGPAALPKEALQQAQADLLNYQGLGYSILEASHRGAAFKPVIEGAEALLREHLGIPVDYAVLFLQGGASLQFCMVPMNLAAGKSCDYADTGSFANKAYKEAKNLGPVKVAASSKEQKYAFIPDFKTWTCDPQAAYLHITSNNTIFGTQYASFPTPPAGVPLVADMSSDILSRRFDISKFGLIYAGAQKNLGPSGVTVVIIRKDLLTRSPKTLPTMLNYNTHAAEGSLYNTPCTFGIYLMKLVLEWTKRQGGLAAIEKVNDQKAAELYAAIDASGGYYRGPAQVGSRSRMNVCFNLAGEELEKKFVKQAEAKGLIGLKGHRSVGGIRASIYNAVPLQAVRDLIAFMAEFRKANG